jgi:small subunit ribosomal protein S16
MQRTGRKGHAHFRVVVQDSRQTPSSGRVVAGLGSYNPHTKETNIDVEKAAFYLSNGAQPSDRVALLLKKEGVKLPEWVELADTKKQKQVKNADKLRKNQPAAEVVVEETVADVEAEAPAEVVETPVEAPAEA